MKETFYLLLVAGVGAFLLSGILGLVAFYLGWKFGVWVNKPEEV